MSKKLGSFCELKYGRSLPAQSRHTGKIAVYGSNGIVGWHDTPLTLGPAIIVGRKGSVGALQFSEESCYPIDTTYYIDRSCTDVDLRWLFFMLQVLGLHALNKHVAIPGLNRADVYEKELTLPSSDDQRRVATALGKANELQLLQQHSTTLSERLPHSLFISMFGDPAINPKGWRTAQLSELAAKISDGPFGSNLKTEHYVEPGVRVWRLQDIGVGRLYNSKATYISEEHFAGLPRHHCVPGDVIVGTLGEPNLRAAIIPKSVPHSLNKADCVQIRVKDDVAHPDYVCWLLNMPGTLALAQSLVLGETRARISMGRLKTLTVPVPPIDLQNTFSSRLSRIISLRDAIALKTRDIDDLFLSLQHRAFKCELDLHGIELGKVAETYLPSTVAHADRAISTRPAMFVAPPEVAAQLESLDKRLELGPGDSIPWSEDFFKYRILGQTLAPPFNFNDIWEAVTYVMEDASYETVQSKILDYLKQGILRQAFDENRKEMVFVPQP